MLRTALVASTLAVALFGCGPNLCEQSSKVGTAKQGDCPAEFAGPLLGTSCTSNLAQCSEADQKVLTSVISCLDKIATCSLPAKDSWALQRDTCTGPLTTLSEPCSAAFFMGMPPGYDAGVPDAGPQPITDGGNGLALLAVANQDTVALAWNLRRTADVAKWLLVETDLLGDGRTETELTPGTAINLTIPDAGMNGRRYFIVGVNAAGEVLTGTPFTDAPADAGTPMCMTPNDCPNNQVCDLGTCRPQTCQASMMSTCPPGYGCLLSGLCERTSADGGIFIGGGGRVDAGLGNLPMISNLVSLTPRPPMFSAPIAIGEFAAVRPDLAAFDTARIAVALEQEGQLLAHPSFNRGRDLEDESVTSYSLDTLGSRVHVAWNVESRILYACYVVGRGVRVQKSIDDGRTWGRSAVTFEPPAVSDGGISEAIRDCDIAAYKNGGAIMVTAETEQLVVREFNTDLVVTRTSPAFTSIPADAGVNSVSFPSHPSIAAQPSSGLVHVTFTGTRLLTGGSADSEPYGVFRDGTAQNFSTHARMTPFTQPSALPEDWTTVSVHPVTGRAVGAFTSVQAGTNNSTVYVSLFNAQARAWGTGSHLNVFVTDQNTSVWLPEKAPTAVWYAFSPQFAPLADGTFAFSFVAGPNTGASGDYRMYLVPFDLDRTPSITSGRGWFIPPVQKISDDRILDPRAGQASPQPPVTAIAADSQISVHGVYIQGSGPAGDVPSPAKFFSWPQ